MTPSRPSSLGLTAKKRALLERLLEGQGVAAPATSQVLPRADRDRVPASFAQERLWFLEQLAPGSGRYNISRAIRLQGPLDASSLERSLGELLRRHEVLRTQLVETGGRPVQEVLPAGLFPLPLVDLAGIGEDLRLADAQRRAQEDAARPFDLSRGPLIRGTLLRLGVEDHVLVLTLHHVAADAWSMGILFGELGLLYAAFREGRPSPLPELPVQYGDFAAWQRAHLDGDAVQRQLAYWKERLGNRPAVLELPADRPRPAVPTFRGAECEARLSAALRDELKQLAQREGATLFMVVLSAYVALLHRYTGRQDLIVGSPVAGRTRSEVEGLVGFFVNLLALRVDLSGDPTFREVLGRVRESVLGAQEHQDLPFERLVEELDPTRDAGRSPLFELTFALQNAPRRPLEMPGLVPSALGSRVETTRFDLECHVAESAAGLGVSIRYNTELFLGTTVERLLGHYARCLEEAVARPGARVSELALLDEGERRQLVEGWNATGSEYPREACVHELFSAQARVRPEAVAVVFGEERLSYWELEVRSNRLARYLRRLGVGVGTRVGLCVERSAGLVVSTLAILKAGGAYLPLDPSYPSERLAFMLRDGEVGVVVTQEALRERLPEQAGTVVCLEEERGAIDLESDAPVVSGAVSEDLAYVIYTSGSTGEPKGVCVSHRAVSRLVLNTNYVELGAGDVVAQASNASFDAATFELWGALLNGGRVEGLSREVTLQPREFAAELRERGVKVLFLTTALFNLLARDAPGAFEGLETLLFGGEAVDPRWVRAVVGDRGPRRLLHVYGPTETTTFATWHLVEGVPEEASSVPIGLPISNTTAYVLDGRMEPVPHGVAGELYLGGEGLARGYWRRPDLTAERFVPDPFGEAGGRLYRTGDLVKRGAGGAIEFLGRVDHQVKLRGFRVELGEIESALREDAEVREAAVLLREDGAAGRRLVAYVVRAAGGRGGWDALREHLRRRLPDYMVPAAFVALEALPLTPNGKLDRHALPAPAHEEAGSGVSEEAPRDAVEEILAGIFGELLGLEIVGVEESFFDLGGHSLLATQVVSRVREALGVELRLREVFETPTVRALGAAVGRARARGGSKVCGIERVSREGDLALSFAQQRMWLLEQLEGGRGLYNVGAGLRLKGDLDVGALERSLGEIVRRHEALRTRFERVEGRVVQRVDGAVLWRLEVEDLTGLAEEDREREARRVSSEESRRAFDLERGPLVRGRLLRVGEDEHVFVLVMHHLVSDGWSIGILVKELKALYAGYREGREAKLPELAVQYADYASWQRQWLRGEELESQLGYWKERLSGAPRLLELPTDHPRPAVQGHRGARRELSLSVELAEGLKQLSRREGATLFMVLLAAFDVVLRRHSGQSDVVVGSPIAGRTRKELEGLIGFFVNTLVLRTDVSGDPTFRELVGRVREVALGAYAHQDLPFEKLVEELNPERATSHHPLFQVAFALQNAPRETLQLPGLEISAPRPGEEQVAKFDLFVQVAESDRGLGVSASFDTDLFLGSTVERLLEHYRRCLEGAVARPGARVSELSLMDEEERRRLVEGWNATSVVYPRESSIGELFTAQAERSGESVAVVCGAERVSYGELERRSNQLGRALRRRGVGVETRVGVLAERSVELVVGLLGVLKAGGVYVPLDAEYPRERLEWMVRDAELSLLLTQERLLGRVGVEGMEVVCLDRDWGVVSEEESGAFESGVGGEHLAYVTYTSGSTGVPKGVEVKHRGVVRLVIGADYAELGPGEVFLQLAPVTFDASTLELWGALLQGGRCVLYPGRVPTARELGEELRRQGVTTLWLTSSLFNAVVDEAPEALSGLKQLLIGGEALSLPHVRKGLERLPGTRIINGYGPTEGTTFTCCYTIPRELGDVGSVPIGGPISNTRVYVLDGGMEPVPVGVVGELYIGGDGLARGYWKRAELTAERFVPDPFAGEPGGRLYRTGDLVRWLAEGRIEFLGRVDHQVKLRGYRIELGEIEAALLGHPWVKRSAVVVREDVPGDKRLVGYVVWREESDKGVDGGERTVEDVRRHLRAGLPEPMVPGVIVELADLPLGPNGKVDRDRLPAPGPRASRAGALEAPRGAVERAVAGAWREVLGLEEVGRDDNFFDLGGHSLLLVQVHEKLKNLFPVSNLTVVDLFKHPSVASVAGRLGAPAESPVMQVRSATDRASLARPAAGETAVAIVGMSGRFPGAPDTEAYWRNLRSGVESLTPLTDEELRGAGVGPALLASPSYVKAGAVLDGVEMFGATFFGYTPREAEVMDPQHRLFLETAWEALEKAGYDPEACGGGVGVYAGASMSSYYQNNIFRNPEFLASVGALQAKIGNDKDALATRVSYKLNLRGPSLTVQTACSTSLVAVHLACRALLAGECDMALAGGVSIAVPQRSGYLYAEGMILSPDGHCRAFDARAQGTIAGSGVGVVVLKRLCDAVRDGDTIHAVVKGSAINNDGSGKVGYTAPGVDGQARVIRAALEAAEVGAETIGYVEAHGTGTALGDPIEVEALTQVFREETQRRGFCMLGSVKTNIGHLDAAAGVAGLIKAVLAVERGELPPSLHYENPNPKIDFASSPFEVNTRLRSWASEGPRRAGVSSFGIGGTNAHVVLEEAPGVTPSEASEEWQLLVLSGKTEGVLERARLNLREHLESRPGANLADVSYTLQVGRGGFGHRRTTVVRDVKDAVAALGDEGRWEGGVVGEGRVAFVFPGQGSQHPGMGEGLYKKEGVYREAVDACAEVLRPSLGLDLREVMYPAAGEERASAERLRGTELAQPALFVTEYALSRLWMSWGVEPVGMLGHSVGEYVAAHLSGVFTLEGALGLVAERGRLMESLPRGAMVAVPLGESELLPLLGEEISLAAVNGPGLCVASGPEGAVAGLEGRLRERGVECRRLHTSHAFHSAMMDPILERFGERVVRAQPREPGIRFVSNVTGDWITDAEATDAGYWTRHLRSCVRFGDGVGRLLREVEGGVLLEVGPGRTLTTLAGAAARGSGVSVVSSLAGTREGEDERAAVLKALGRVWVSGAKVEWEKVHARTRRNRVPLPTYPFERQRYWVDPSPKSQARVSREPEDLSEWFYIPSWKRTPPRVAFEPASTAGPSARWLLLGEGGGLVDQLALRLRRAAQSVVRVTEGPAFARLGDGAFALRPGSPEDHVAVLAAMREEGGLPGRVLHLWGLTPEGTPRGREGVARIQELGFRSVLALARALGGEASGQEVRLGIVTNGMQEVSGEGLPWPEKATVLGPCRVAPQEYPGLSCLAIDVVAPRDGASSLLAESLLAECSSPFDERVVALRGIDRWVESFEPVRLPARAGVPKVLREGGCYLVTGGLGGIGLALAESLAGELGAKLVLVGRRGLPPRDDWEAYCGAHADGDAVVRRIRKVRELEALGAEVLVLSADVSKLSSMRGALAEAEARFGRIDGVIHAAGVAGGGTIALRARDAVDAVLAPKVEAVLVLEELLRDKRVDFVALCSSLASVLGGFGQADYSGANAFLDAWARHRSRAGGGLTVSIDWDTWREAGMAVDTALPGDLEGARQERLRKGLASREGVEAFRRILRERLPQVVVARGDLETRRQAAKAPSAAPSAARPPRPAGRHARPALAKPYEAPRDDVERTIAGLWREILGFDEIGVNDSFFDLGGHSLVATQIVNRLRETFSVRLSLESLFEAPTVAGLARALVDGEPRPGQVQEIARLAQGIESLSEGEMQRLLQGAKTEGGAA